MRAQFIGGILGLFVAFLLIKWDINSNKIPGKSDIDRIKDEHFMDSLHNLNREFFIAQQEPNFIDSLNRKQGNWALFFNRDSTLTNDPFLIAKKLTLQFNNDEPIAPAIFYDYYKKQVIWKVNLIKRDSNYVFDGIYTRFYADGTLLKTSNYKNGQKNGIETNYYSNGSLKSIQTFVNNILDGKSINYYENGNIKEKETYKEGHLSGYLIQYHPSGKKLSRQFFISGIQNGDYREYYENGNLKTQGKYSNGNRCSSWKYFDPYGAYLETQFLDIRVGAICNDGTRSNATGRGACSHHGGVNYWLTENREIQINNLSQTSLNRKSLSESFY